MRDKQRANGGRVNLAAAFGLTMLLAVVPTAPPESPVADAAERQDIETVRSLLRQGADVNAAQGDGMTALHWAVLADDPAMVEVLMYAGANLESTTRLGAYTPLHLSSEKGRSSSVKVLLEAGARVDASTTTGAYPIHFAAQAGDPETLRLLLQHGADANARETYSERTALMFATANNRLAAVEVLLANGADVSLASKVVDYGERDKADTIERRRRARVIAAAREPEARETQDRTTAPDTASAVPDSTAKAAADSTAATPHEPTQARPAEQRREREPAPLPEPDSISRPDTLALDQAGATTPDPAEPRPLSYSETVGKQGGFTAMHYAVRDGRSEVVRTLLEAGADVNGLTLGDESSPLLISIINGNYDLAMYLLEQGADPNLASEDGAAPLFATVNNEWALRTWYPQPTANKQQKTTYLELMRALLDLGADPNARVNTHIWYAAYNAGRMGVDFSGATAFWRAAYSTDVQAMRLLVEYGADPNIPTIKPASRRRGGEPSDSTEELDPSGLPPVPAGGPAVYPLHAASGVGYGTSRVGQQHRHVPDGWLPAVRYLVDSLGVDVNVRDHDAYTAVHNAAARGDNEVIEYLIEKGADVTLVSRRGQTTVDMANGPQQRVQPFPETIALLERHGGINNNKCQSCE